MRKFGMICVLIVDVTDLMVQPFNPDEETLKTIKEIQMKDPVPLKHLSIIMINVTDGFDARVTRNRRA